MKVINCPAGFECPERASRVHKIFQGKEERISDCYVERVQTLLQSNLNLYFTQGKLAIPVSQKFPLKIERSDFRVLIYICWT